MAKLKVKNLKNIEKKVGNQLRKDIRKQMRSKELRDEIGQIVVDGIKETNYGSPRPFTLALREYFEQFNKTDPSYRRNKINITFTGELLRDLAKNVKVRFSKSGGEYVIEHSNGGHAQLKGGKKKSDRLFKKKTHKETRFDKKTGQFKQVNRASKTPYKFISIQLIKRLGYNYLKFSRDTEIKIKNLIQKRLFKGIKDRFK